MWQTKIKQHITLQSSAATDSISFLKLLASNGVHSLTSGITGGKYHGMHLSSSFLFERTFFMLHSRMQDTCSNSSFYSHIMFVDIYLISYLGIIVVGCEWMIWGMLIVKVTPPLCGLQCFNVGIWCHLNCRKAYLILNLGCHKVMF